MMKKNRILFIVFVFIASNIFAAVKLPRLISNGMILQRDCKLTIWGWAQPTEKVTVSFLGKKYTVKTNQNSEWKIKLKNLKAGGPYKMQIKGDNKIELENIMIGDVWMCAGQSNMAMSLKSADWFYSKEITNCTNPNIRQFRSKEIYDFHASLNDFKSGTWESVNPNSIMDFSVLPYFFAKNLYEKHSIPIGLITSASGGTPAEAWMSEDAIKNFPVHYSELQKCKDDAFVEKTTMADDKKSKQWLDILDTNDKGNKEQPWYLPETITSDWKKIHLPDFWNKTDLENINGVVWLRKEFELNAAFHHQPALLQFGHIIDSDWIYINGILVGKSTSRYSLRRYQVPANVLKQGKNTITVRIINKLDVGGVVPEELYQLNFGNEIVPLSGEWKYKIGATTDKLDASTVFKRKPAGLYNGMIVPAQKYAIKGVIWYQGETNENRPIEYEFLLKALINDWRSKWNCDKFPFLLVQLPNFREAKAQPSESNWALLRESQAKASTLSNTAMVVAIDQGTWQDIHPTDKREIARRLALAAENIAYGNKSTIYNGPIYKSMKIVGDKIEISFTNLQSGLTTLDGKTPSQFAIAGIDKKFVWADAKIEGNKIIVWSKYVINPKAVRYAWADTPLVANVNNKEGLPAMPFRTDNWKTEIMVLTQ